MIIRTAIIAAALSTTFAATSAQAESYNVQAVSYADLNLASEKGQHVLDRRLTRAVKKVCDRGPTRSVTTWMGERKCRQQARESYADQRELAIKAAQDGRALAMNTLTVSAAMAPRSL